MAEETKSAEPSPGSLNEEFEEVLVYVDFPDFDECSFLNESSVLELHDVTGAKPTCKINNVVFSGQQEMNLGTQMFFAHDDASVGYVGSSTQVVKFRLSKFEK